MSYVTRIKMHFSYIITGKFFNYKMMNFNIFSY